MMPDSAKTRYDLKQRGFATLHREEVVRRAVRRVAAALDAEEDVTQLDFSSVPDGMHWELDCLTSGCSQMGVYTRRLEGTSTAPPISAVQLLDLVREDHVAIIPHRDGEYTIIERQLGRNIEVSLVDGSLKHRTLPLSAVADLLSDSEGSVIIASRELACKPLGTTSSDTDSHGHAEHPSPFRRFMRLLRLEANDIGTVVLFALVSGVLALATPLAVESLVNVVSWGTYLQPLIVLALILLASLGLSGVLKILQTVVVEIIQRRQFVRIVGDLAHRFPRAQRKHLASEFPRELANRVFDIMTIQKATAVLLLDGVSIALATGLGMMLLAFYHPFLLGFNIALLLTMISLTWVLGRGGIRTSIDESIAKYKIVHWLQDVIAYPGAFKINGGEDLAIETANGLAAEYLEARESQFRVVIRQVAFAIGLQVCASTALLGLGGWLVIGGQLTLGQLVASELVVTVVVGAFAKAGKSLEKFYDLMAGIDKVGHLLDIPVDARRGRLSLGEEAASLHWSSLVLKSDTRSTSVAADRIDRGQCLAVTGNDLTGRRLFIEAVAGAVDPAAGVVSVEEMDATEAALAGRGRLTAIAADIEVFHGTISDNVELGRAGIGINRLREVLVAVGLWNTIHELPNGLSTKLQTGGYPLDSDQLARLMLARAIAARPKLLVIDRLLDQLPASERREIWHAIRQSTSSLDGVACTIVLGTDIPELLAEADRVLEIS